MRRTISSDLGFGRSDRAQQARRASDIARRAAGDGAIAIVSLVSPHSADRHRARSEHQVAGLPFVEVHVSTPLAVGADTTTYDNCVIAPAGNFQCHR
jgi:bifunctional enzyme CysN/CysC